MPPDELDGQLNLYAVLDPYRYHPDYLGIDLLDVNQPGAVDDCPLHIASRSGDLAQVAALIRLGADVNAPGDIGYTPLHYAAMKGHWPIAAALVEHGADFCARNELGETTSDVARLADHLDFVAKMESIMRGRES